VCKHRAFLKEAQETVNSGYLANKNGRAEKGQFFPIIFLGNICIFTIAYITFLSFFKERKYASVEMLNP
jgi:hypothetical protein